MKRSKSFNEFINLTLTKDPNQRSSAQDLLSHPFLSPQADSQEIIKSLLKRSQEYKKLRLMSKEDYHESFDFDIEKNHPQLPPDVNLKEQERQDSINKTLPSQSIKQTAALSFKAERICRLGFKVNCTEFWSKNN